MACEARPLVTNLLTNVSCYETLLSMIRQIWRLNEGGDDNLGVACSDKGLFLGRTPLIELRHDRFIARDRGDIERLLACAYRTEITADRLMPGLATVASALNAHDMCLACIAAVHLRLPE